MTPETKALIEKACSRKNLGREEQRRLGLELQDALLLTEYQAGVIKEMKNEIIRLKMRVSEDRSSLKQNKVQS